MDVMLTAKDALELALASFNSTVIEFVDLLNHSTEPSTWPATDLLASWGRAQAAVRATALEESAALDTRSAKALDRYDESVGFLLAIEEETRPKLSEIILAQFAADCAEWREYLSRVQTHGVGAQADTGEDDYTISAVCDYRDFLAFAWRGVALAKIDDSKRLPGVDPDQMRRDAAKEDALFARILAGRRPSDPLADAEMWWHVSDAEPRIPTKRGS